MIRTKPRFVRRDRKIYDFASCQLCGTCWGVKPGCDETTCAACGTTQCMGNGLGRGQCSICYIGLLPGWSGYKRPCRYKNCPHQAVAVDGKWNCCLYHIERRKPGYIAARIAERDKRWMEV